MIRISFSQCCSHREYVGASVPDLLFAGDRPILEQIAECEQKLMEAPNGKVFWTYSEYPLLIAQWYHRNQIRQFEFVSWCKCRGVAYPCFISLDSDGDMLDEPHHGFFTGRLKYLR